MLDQITALIATYLPEPHAGLLAGMVFGVRSQFSKELQETLITTGTIHIVALSGQNISILVSIIGKVTLIFGRKLAVLCTLVGIIGFVCLVGIEPPIVRAALMGGLTLFATISGRRNWGVLSLFLVASVMLLIFPAWIFEVSFQLSFLATLGIILLASKPMPKASSWFKEILIGSWGALRTTLAAQLFTLPIIILTFQRISLIAPVSNVLISWAISPIMILGLLFVVVGSVLPFVGDILSWVLWLLLSVVLFVITTTGSIPLASFSW